MHSAAVAAAPATTETLLGCAPYPIAAPSMPPLTAGLSHVRPKVRSLTQKTPL